MLSVFGVRHHGPGSARSLLRGLAALRPDCILVEGPPEAEPVLPLMLEAGMEPPVALLIYEPEDLKQAVFYPFAVYSPEWQALQFGLGQKIPVRFMDLPTGLRFGAERARREARETEAKKQLDEAQRAQREQPAPSAPGEADPAELAEAGREESAGIKPPHPRHDPLRWLAEAGGYNDGERWWEHMVEQRQDAQGMFAAVLEAMGALRLELPPLEDAEEIQEESCREAHMRQTIRAAQKEGFQRIAVVCGAWHAPVLAGVGAGKDPLPPGAIAEPTAREDAAVLKGIPRRKVAATWVPWTYPRLAAMSGYGAGVISPGWYEHLWQHETRAAEHWLTRVARLLRHEDLDASSAQTIEAVRLVEALAALRGRPLPGLDEMNEAARTIFCFGNDLPMRLIFDRLVIGSALGRIPDATPMVPLQQDIQREQKRLRLQTKALPETLELDLRKEFDLDRSRLFHRLNLLEIPWGRVLHARGKGTFKEAWQLEWKPEFSVRTIEASRFGVGVLEAAGACAIEAAAKTERLPDLTELIDRVLLADLPAATPSILRRLESVAAVTSDVGHLMEALPALAQVQRYGSVRQTDVSAVGHILAGLVARICAGLPPACGSLNDDAAHEMFTRIGAVHSAVQLIQVELHTQEWQGTLARLAQLPNLHGLIAGRACRLMLDAGAFAPADTAQRLSLALSAANDPTAAAHWMEGFLTGSGQVLLHDERLWNLVDEWMSQLPREAFDTVVPLLRRTFSSFTPPERRSMGERVKASDAAGMGTVSAASGGQANGAGNNLDHARAAAVLPMVKQLLGLS